MSQLPPDTAVTISEAPTVKKRKICVDKGDWLPEPCPIPALSERIKAMLAQNGVKANNKFLLREAASFYNGLCPNPTTNEYVTMAKTLCNKYPELKDKQPVNGKYWVSINLCETFSWYMCAWNFLTKMPWLEGTSLSCSPLSRLLAVRGIGMK